MKKLNLNLRFYKKVISDGAIKDELDTEILDYAVDNIEYIHEADATFGSRFGC